MMEHQIEGQFQFQEHEAWGTVDKFYIGNDIKILLPY